MTKVWNFKKELVCLFGKPVAENPTQHMMEAAFHHHGLDWRYITFEVDPKDLGDAVKGMRACGLRGGNCTIPHKLAVIPHLDRLGESASVMGAVNCIVRRGAELVGENTDGKGFVSSLREIVDPKGKRVVILGAGGASRAIAVETALAGAAHILILNRTASKAEELAKLVADKVKVAAAGEDWKGDYKVPAGTDVLINATSIGLFPDVDARIPLDMSTVTKAMVVADVIPNPPRTRLVREAEAKGCKVIDGLGMLVAQGVIGFEYWTGVKADADVMRRALQEVFGES
ncbi:MAG: shikimate dehydrogenase [Planctomycetes bacterium]|nr:shikimate dehydrogenase [Planctomycetota bacterium]